MKQNKHILIRNIYYMLAYAFQALKQSTFEDIAKEEFDNIQNLFAAILGKGISQQLKQGLYREYLNRKEDLSVMHGKINMPGTIRNRIAHRQKLTCEFDELSENNLYNQILKTTAMLLLRSDEVESEYKDILRKEMLFFSQIDMVEASSISWAGIRYHRNNQTYRMLLGVCQLVLEGMLLTSEYGENRLASFVDDQYMCRLYEKFILEYYIREFPELHAASSQIHWALDKGNGEFLPIMQSDIMLSYQDTILIIDAKYYSRTMQTQYDVHTQHSHNLYQIFTYVKNKTLELPDNVNSVSGMLLYARTDEAIQPDQSYHMSGNRIDVKTLDLNCDFSEITAQLNHIAEEFFHIKKEKELQAYE